MNDINKLKEQQKDKHPAFGSYLECMSRSLFAGLATFSIGFSGIYFAQKLVEGKLPYIKKYNILVPSILASVAAYKVTSDRTKACQAAWMAAEDKYSEFKD